MLAAANAPIDAPDIQATINGAPAKVVSVASPVEDLILMLVMDLAGDLTLAERAKIGLVE